MEMSIDAIVARLEAQIAYHREREAFHSEQGAHHQERQTLHATELATLTASLESFKSVTATALGLASRETAAEPLTSPPQPLAGKDLDIGRKPSLTRMVTRVVESRAPGEVFGTSAVTKEIQRRYGDRLRRPAKAKMVSITLRRMANDGRLRAVREGRPHHEALYARE